MPAAIRREKRLKRWNREWKYRLIEQMNPDWRDLFDPRTGEIGFGPAEAERLAGEPVSDDAWTDPRPSRNDVGRA